MTVTHRLSDVEGKHDYLIGQRDWITLMPAAAELAKAVANTEFVPKSLRGNPAAITAAILYGDEVGIGPMQSLARISVIDGRPTLAAETQRALIFAAGHEIWVEEATNTRVSVAGRRKDSDQTSRVTWTMDDAKRANLAGRQNWRTYPRQMLLARATAELARAVFADAIGGLAATEELEELEDTPAGVSEATEDMVASRNRRRRRRAVVAAVSAPAQPQPEPERAALPPLPGEESASEPNPPDPAGGAEPDDKESAPSDADLMSGPQRRKMQALFRQLGIDTREARLAFTRFAIGRSVSTSLQLTVEEASKLIETLEAHVQAAVDTTEPPS